MKTTLSVGIAALLILTACADDGNDAGFQARQASERAAEFRRQQEAERAAQEAPDPADAPDAPGPADEPVTTVPPTTPATTLPPVEPTGVVVPVFALDNTFRPQVIEINVGDEVLWENRGINEHDILRVEGDGWGVDVLGFQPGAVYAHVFTEPGVFDYYCSIHGNETVGMIGTVIVNA